MKPLVLTPTEQAEAVGHVLAVRQLGQDMIAVFSRSGAKEAKAAVRGADAMVASLNKVLELLDAPRDLELDEQS